MTLKQLRYFAQVAHEGSFAAAARVLYVAQPSISQQVAKLEAELGVTLFVRQARGIVLTESGERLLDHAHAILRHIESAKADVSSTPNNPQGTAVLGLTQSICNLLPLYLMDMMATRYPRVTLDITVGLTSNLRQWLLDGAIDVAVFASEEQDDTVCLRTPLIQEELFFVTTTPPERLPLQVQEGREVILFADLAEFELILPSSTRDSLGMLVERLEQSTGIRLRKRPGVGQLMTNLSFVLAGDCGCLLSSPAIHHLVDSGAVTAVPVADPNPRRDIFVHTSLDQPLTTAAEKAVQLIVEATALAQEEGRWRGDLL